MSLHRFLFLPGAFLYSGLDTIKNSVIACYKDTSVLLLLGSYS